MAPAPQDRAGPGHPVAPGRDPRCPARGRRRGRLDECWSQCRAGHDHRSGHRLPHRVRGRDGGRPDRQRRRPGRPHRRDRRHRQLGRDAHRGPRQRRARRAADCPRRRPARPQPGHARRRGPEPRPRHLGRPGAPARVERLPPHHQRERRVVDPRAPPRAALAGDQRPAARWPCSRVWSPTPSSPSPAPRSSSPSSASRPRPSTVSPVRSRAPRTSLPTLRTANQRHASQIREDSATDLGGGDAYEPYDEITELLIDGVDDLAHRGRLRRAQQRSVRRLA